MRHRVVILLLLGFAGLCTAATITCCGKSSNSTCVSQPSAAQAQGDDGLPVLPTECSNEEAILSVKSSEPPGGIDPALWELLTSELARVISESRHGKIAAAPPTGDQNGVFNLHFDTGAVDTSLAWTHVCIGDYNSDGLVSINDLTPIGQNYLVAIGDYNWAQAQVADGNGDGMVTINDITPIGQRYLVQTVEYHVYGSTDLADYPASHEDGNGDARLVATVVYAESTPGLGNRALFTAAVDAPVAGEHYWVRPSDGETEGSPSNCITANGRGDWWMHGREPTHNNRSIFYGPRSNNVAWSYATGDEIYSSPAIRADGWIYVGSRDNSLHAVSPQGGGEWTFPVGDSVYSPAIGADGTVYFGSWDGNLYAVNPDGSLVWSHTTDGSPWFSPAIGPDGTIYVGCNDDNLYAILPDETVAWSFPTGAGVHTCPTIGPDGTVYFGCYDFNVYAVDSEGNEVWTFTTEDNVTASVALAADGTAYVGNWMGSFYAIDPSGNELWHHENLGSIHQGAAIGADGTVYVGSARGYLSAFDPGGSLLWRFYAESSIYTAPAIGADGIIYIGDHEGIVYAINPDGTQLWSYSAGDEIGMGLAIGADGTLYAGSADGNLYAFNGGEAGTAATVVEVPVHEGLEGSELTFHATVAGSPPLQYTWNFGGGASPDSASEMAPTVTLGEPEVYTCSLTVENSFGAPDSQTFELLVHSAAPPASGWVHSWGAEFYEDTNAVVADSTGNVHFVGSTDSFDIDENDVLLLEYDSAGTLVSARTWGAAEYEIAYGAAVDAADNVYIAGSCGDYWESDTLLIKLNPAGEITWARTWDSGGMEVAHAVAVRDDGSIVLAGRTDSVASNTDAALFLFYDADGNATSAAFWDTEDNDDATGSAMDDAGNCYVVGTTTNYSEDTADIILWRVTNTNTLEWTKMYVSDPDEWFPKIAIDAAGDAYIATRRYSILKYNSLGELQWANNWANEYYMTTSCIAVLGNNLVVSVGIRVTDNYDAGIFLGDTDGNVSWGRHYMTAYDDDFFQDILPLSLDAVYVAGNCRSAYGTWQDLAVVSEPVLGTDVVPTGTAGYMPAGTQADASGVFTDVVGVEDTGGGNDDATAFCLDLTE